MSEKGSADIPAEATQGGRDFSCESWLNLVFRAMRAINSRLRGRALTYLGAFAPGSSPAVTFGRRPRFVNSKLIWLGRGAGFGDQCRIECYRSTQPLGSMGDPKIVVGDGTSFGDFAHLGATEGISIGRKVLCGSRLLIIDHNHGAGGSNLSAVAQVPPARRPLVSRGPIAIGDHVWIGDAVVVLGGVTIGSGAIIGANTVVSKNVPANTVYYTGKANG